ncbi:MAG: hypothetical protein AAGI15_14080 [Pseudomonadota bacterium]
MNASLYSIANAAGRNARGRSGVCVGALLPCGGDWSQMDHVFTTSKRPPGGPDG